VKNAVMIFVNISAICKQKMQITYRETYRHWRYCGKLSWCLFVCLQ